MKSKNKNQNPNLQVSQNNILPQFAPRLDPQREYIPPIYQKQSNVQYTQTILKPSLQLPQSKIIPQLQLKNTMQMDIPKKMEYEQMYVQPQIIQAPFQPQFYPFTQTKNVQNKELHKDLVKQIILQKRKRQGFGETTNNSLKPEEIGLNPTKKQKHFLSQNSVQLLKEWFYEHLDHPYPSADQKESLSKSTGLTYLQVSNWFTNTRKRIWAPSMRMVNSVKDQEKGENNSQIQQMQQQIQQQQQQIQQQLQNDPNNLWQNKL